MKNIRVNLAISFLIVLLSAINADAKWWIFGQSNDEININYMYINKINYEEIGPEATIYKETLLDSLIHINGKASVRKGKIGGVRVSTSNKERWEEAKFSDNGAFEYSFRPDPDKEYVIYVEIMDTAGKTNDIEATRKKVKISDQNIMSLIREALDKMIEAYRNEDPNRFMANVSDDFAGDETNLDRAIRKDFSAFDNIDLRYTINNVSSGTKGMVFVSINFNRTVISAKDGKTYTDRGATEFTFQLGPARVYSMKNPLIFGLSDAENVATGTVTSSGELNICLNSRNEAGLCVSGIPGNSSGNLLTGSATLRTVDMTNFQGFIFADEEVTNETDAMNITGDFGMTIEGGGPIAFINVRTGVLVKKKAGTSLAQITSADESGYGTFADPGAAGDSYLFKLANNTYGAIEIISLTPSGPGFNGSIRYKYQPDGTRNF